MEPSSTDRKYAPSFRQKFGEQLAAGARRDDEAYPKIRRGGATRQAGRIGQPALASGAAETGGVSKVRRTSNPAIVEITVCLWDMDSKQRRLKARRVVGVEAGSPVIWVYGRFLALVRQLARKLTSGERDLRFVVSGDEVFWFTAVEGATTLHVEAYLP